VNREPLPAVPPGRAIEAAPSEPDEGVVSWNMNTSCNYRCSYCTQRFLDDRGRWARDVPRFLAAFARLPGRWEMKLSGGEPFVHPRFEEIVGGLRELGIAISVVTNFSASPAKLDAFLAAAGERLRVVSCSLHLEYVGVDGRTSLAEFVDKCAHVQARLPPGASLCVTSVATAERLPQLPALRDLFAARGIVFKVQPEKQGREVVGYTPVQRTQLVQLGGHNLTGAIAPDYGGQPCWAGAKYFVLDDRGNAFRCYPARRYRVESLGNLLDGTFTLNEGATPCRYRYCNCTVPISRGMMPRSAALEPGASR